MKILYCIGLVIMTQVMALAQPNSPNEIKPLNIGDSIPNAQIRDLESNPLALRKIVEWKTSIIIFFRGGWCPFCNTHLSQLQDITRILKKKGVQLIAISGEDVEASKQTKEKNSLTYELYSDTNLEAASLFGITFLQNGNWKLPVPSVFICDRYGVIRFVHWDPNYQVRLESTKILYETDKILSIK